MKSYKPSDVRVVGLFGHRGSGRTSLAEAFLYNGGVTSRLGSVESGNQTLEIDEAAVERQMTMAANAGFVEWNGVRVGLIDHSEPSGDERRSECNFVLQDCSVSSSNRHKRPFRERRSTRIYRPA